MTKITPPATLPAAAIGFVTVRKDRPERLAFYRADGSLNTSFAIDQTLNDVRAVMFGQGYDVDADGFVTYRDMTSGVKAGQIFEATSATGTVTLFRASPLPRKDRADYLDLRARGWVLGKWMDAHGGGAHVHMTQLRLISNHVAR